MKEELELYVKPYQYNAFADYIVREHPDYEEWANNHFIELVGMDQIKEDIPVSVDYLSGNIYGKIPLLSIIDYSYLKNKDKDKVIKLIEEGLSAGKRYYVFIDHFYMKNTKEYQNEHMVHDILLIKNEDGKFYFFENVDGFIDEYEMEKALFWKIFYAHDIECIYELGISEEAEYTFDIGLFRKMIEDYTFARDLSGSYKEYLPDCGFYSNEFFDGRLEKITYWGIDVYDIISKKTKVNAKHKEYVDYRCYYILIERNQNMISKLMFCIDRGYIGKESVEDIIERLNNINARIKKNMHRVFKYIYSDFRVSGMDEVADSMQEIKQEEKEVYIDLLKVFEKYKNE